MQTSRSSVSSRSIFSCAALAVLLCSFGVGSAFGSGVTYVALHNASSTNLAAKVISVSGPSFTSINPPLNSWSTLWSPGFTTGSTAWSFADYANGGGSVVVVTAPNTGLGPYYTNTFSVAALNTGSRYVTWDITGGAAPTYNLTRCVENGYLQPVTAWWRRGGVLVKQETLQPGQSDCYTFTNVSPTEVVSYGSYVPQADWGYDPETQAWSPTVTPINAGSGAESNVVASGTSTNTFGAGSGQPQTGWTNLINAGGINWNGTGSGDVARDSTLQAGFSTLAANQQKELNALAAINAEGVNVNVSNHVDVTVTNVPGGTNMTDDEVHSMVSDFADKFYGALSNAVGAQMDNMKTGSGVGPMVDKITGIESQLDGASGIPEDVSASDEVTIPLGPSFAMTVGIFTGPWGAVWDFARKLIGWFITAGFGILVARDLIEVARAIYSVQVGKVPNFIIFREAFGTGGGGNLGQAIFPIIVVVIAAAFLIITVKVVTLLTGWDSLFSNLSTSGILTVGAEGGSAGVRALLRAFPLHLLMNYMLSYIAWRLELAAILSTLGVSVRALPG